MFYLPATTKVATADASVNENSINYLIDVYFQKYGSELNFKKSFPIEILGKHYDIVLTGKLTKAPFLDLAPMSVAEFSKLFFACLEVPTLPPSEMISAEDPVVNAKVIIDGIELTISGKDIPTQELTVKAEIVGFIAGQSSVLTIQGIDGKIYAQGKVDPIATAVFKVAIDILKQIVRRIPLPQPQYMGICGKLESAIIANKDVQITFSATPVDISSVEFDPVLREQLMYAGENAEENATIKASTGNAMVNLLIEHFCKLPSFKEVAQTSSHGFGMRAEVLGGIQPPNITFANDTAEAKSELGFRASVGVQFFGEWLDVGVTPANVYVDLLVQFEKDASGKTILLKLIPNFDSIIIDFIITLPGFLKFLLHPIQVLLGKIVKLILAAMKEKILGLPIPIFTVKSPQEIFRVPFDWKFSEFGIKGNLFKAEVTAVVHS